MNKNKFYVTTPIYYVNGKPHIGTLYSTLLADVTARWNKIQGKKVFFLTGTDEHGQKVAEKAEELGISPQELVDKNAPLFEKVWKSFDIEYDRFIRTTEPEHLVGVNKLMKILIDKGDIYKSTYAGPYCVPCETFVTASSELKDDKGNVLCPSCQRATTEVEEEAYFFRLSAYADQLLKFYKENPTFIAPKERLNEVISFVKGDVRDVCFSRKSVKWGIPFPGDPEHTIYVWGDALTNYLSGIGYGTSEEDFNFWWPADIHVMAKDIVRFHAVYWPAMLLAADIPLPKREMVHGYILVDEQKMSKSLGNAVDPENLRKNYGVDQVRYYLMRHMPPSQDGNFDLEQLEKHIDADLANNFGNLLNRIASLALNNGVETVNPAEAWEPASASLKEKCEEAFRSYWDEMNHYQYHIALANLWTFISEVNAYVHSQEPWKVVKQNRELFEEIVSAVCHSLYAVGVLLWPIMPRKMEVLLSSLGVEFDPSANNVAEIRKNLWNKKFVLSRSKDRLFPRVESQLVEKDEAPEKTVPKKTTPVKDDMITIDDFVKVELIVGTIMTCEPLEGSEKLLKMSVDFGDLGKRQILAGVAKSFKSEELVGEQGVFVGNLPPRKMAGTESQGMMLFAKDDDGKYAMATVSAGVKNGTRLG